MKQTKPQEDGKYQTTGEEKTESSTDSAAHPQALQQQKNVNGRNHHIPINVNTECQWTQLPKQKTLFGNWVKKEDPTICCLQETHLIDRNKHWLRVKGSPQNRQE
jgi:hypothetical protein